MLPTDASNTGLGAVLTQNFSEGERVIAYASRTLNPAKRNYSATKLECLAVIWGIQQMREYLEGYSFILLTDHQSLQWLQKLDAPTGCLGRWDFEIQQYPVEIKYCKGSQNTVADALSREPTVAAADKPRRCPWFNRLLTAAQQRPRDHPDYAIRDGQLFRYVLHTFNFWEVPSDEQ